MNRYLVHCVSIVPGHGNSWFPGPFGSLREAITTRTPGCVAHSGGRESRNRQEVFDWLTSHGIDHFYTVETHKMHFLCSVTKERYPAPVELVVLSIPEDDDAFHLRMRFGIKPLGPDADIRSDPPPLWRIPA